MSVIDPRPNPETVAALLDTAWKLAAFEERRTDALDRKTATLATFSSILASVAALSIGTLVDAGLPRSLEVIVGAEIMLAICLLATSVVIAVIALLPREYVGLGVAYLRRLPTWREVRKPPELVQGDTLHGLVESVVHGRRGNDLKMKRVRVALTVFLAGIILIALASLTLTLWIVTG